MKPQKDVLQVTISDLHSGSNYALFLPYQWYGRNGMTHTPTPLQRRIEEHKNFFCDVIAQRRKGAKLILVHNDDAIDGDHHHSADVCTVNELEQAEIHIEIMEDIKKRMGWERGDELHYTRGTNVHVKHWEDYIADRTNASIAERLELRINGRLFVWSHHGASAGLGANEGNALRNKLKALHETREKYGHETPDVVYFGHVHHPAYAVHAYHKKLQYREIRGIVTPSWQRKTSFAWQVATLAPSIIGGAYMRITAGGLIDVPTFVYDEQIY